MGSESRRGFNPLRRLRSRLSRIRHFRGHGIHSPFIYAIVREVFMRRTLIPSDTMQLLEIVQRIGGLKRRYVVELQNVASHCGYRNFAVDTDELKGVDLVVVTTQYSLTDNLSVDDSLEDNSLVDNSSIDNSLTDSSVTDIGELVKSATANGTTVVILHPESRVSREAVCDRIVAEHRSTTVRRAEYLLIFNNHLPKQHFAL